MLSEAAEDLRSRAPHSGKAEELLQKAEGLEDASGLMAPMSYDPGTRKQMTYESYGTRRGRPKR